MRRLFASLATVAVSLAGCSEDIAGPDPLEPEPPFTVSVEQSEDHAPLTLGLTVAVAPSAAVAVDYWTDGEPRMRVQRASAETHDLLLARLLPDRTYRYEVSVQFDGASLQAEPVSGEFTTDTLPDALKALELTSTGESTSPLVMLDLWEAAFRGFAAVDSRGRIVWYHGTSGGAWGWTRRANGNFVFLDSQGGLNEVTPARDTVATLPNAHGDPIHHDVVATPRNTLYLIARHTQDVDGVGWAGEAIYEWDPDTGALNRRWTSHDFLSPKADTTERSSQGDWIHGNSLHIGPSGHVLLSSPWLNQVLAITPDFSALAWRLGGKNATVFTDSSGTFDFQHTATQLAENRVLVFDNRGGEDAGLPHSRALELELDFAADSARAVWSFRAPNDNYASIVSAARRMDGGNTLVTFGTREGFLESRGPVEVYEVEPDGTIVWNLVAAGADVMYRATPFGALAGETVVQ